MSYFSASFFCTIYYMFIGTLHLWRGFFSRLGLCYRVGVQRSWPDVHWSCNLISLRYPVSVQFGTCSLTLQVNNVAFFPGFWLGIILVRKLVFLMKTVYVSHTSVWNAFSVHSVVCLLTISVYDGTSSLALFYRLELVFRWVTATNIGFISLNSW